MKTNHLLKIENWKLKIILPVLLAVASLVAINPSAHAATISKPTQSLGLVGYWSFDIGKGTAKAVDLSGRGNHGTLTNMNPTSAWVGGKIGNALEFDRVDDYVTITPISNIRGSISAWVKPSFGLSVSTYYSILAGTSGGNDWSLQANTFGGYDNYELDYRGGFGTDCEVVAEPDQTSDALWQRWTHVAVTWNISTGASIYVNGALAGTSTCTTGTPSLGSYQIGGKDGGSLWQGSLDEVRVYNRALSADEIKRLYRLAGPKMKDPPAISRTNLTSGTATCSTTCTTASISPSPNKLILLAVYLRQGGGSYTNPSVSGNGLTWVKFQEITAGAGVEQLFLFRAMGKNPTSGTAAISTSVSATGHWSIIEYDNIDTSGTNGSGAIVQTGENSASSDSSLTVTMNNFSSTRNYTYGALGKSVNTGTVTPGDGFTEIHEVEGGGDFETEDRSSPDTTVTWNAGATATLVGIGAEIKALSQPLRANITRRGITNGLVGHWSFDGSDMSGNTAYDRSGNGNNGTLTNGPRKTIGRIGQAIDFEVDGNDEYVNLGSPSSLDDLATSTVCAWIKPEGWGESNNGRIYDGGDSCCNGWYIFRLDNDGTAPSRTLRFVMDFNTTDLTRSGASDLITLNEWQHACMTWDGNPSASGVKFYVNGNESSSYGQEADGAVSMVFSPTESSFIGNGGSGKNGSFDGVIDDVRVYNRVLSLDEIRRLYLMGW